MKRIRALAGFAVVGSLLALATGFKAAPPHAGGVGSAVKLQHFDGFPYPGDLLKLDRADLRATRWKLFAQLVALNGHALKVPVWKTWNNKCDLDLSRFCDGIKNTEAHAAFVGGSPQLDLPGADSTQRFSVVYYSPAAAAAIKEMKLNNAPTLQRYLLEGLPGSPEGHVNLPATAGFPNDSIIVKGIWEGFPDGPGNSSQELVRVYDPSDPQYKRDYESPTGQLKGVAQWRKINIGNSNGIVDMDPKTECGGDYQLDSTVPIQCFYYEQYPRPCQPNMQGGLILSPVIPGHSCVVVLVGLQVMTKEGLDNWAWSTFWWTNQPSITPRNLHDPGSVRLPPQYSHYVMQTTVGPRSAAARLDDPVFNPYLEGPRHNGPASDCIVCHARAHYNPSTTVAQDYKGHESGQRIDGDGQERDITGGSAANHPCVLKTLQNPALPCILFTGFIWSLSTSQDPLTQQAAVLARLQARAAVH